MSDIIFNVVKKNFGLTLGVEFAEVMEQIMNSIHSSHAKPVGMSDKDHITNLNKLTISECIKYVKAKREGNHLSSNYLNGLSDNNNMSSYRDAFSGGGLIPHPGGMIPPPQIQQGGNQGMSFIGGGMGGMGGMMMGGMPGFNPMMMQGGGGGGPGGMPLPFQQIDPRADPMSSDPEILLAKKINDRNSLDVTVGGRPQMGGFMPNLPNYNGMHVAAQQQQIGKFLQTQANAHPAVVQQFLMMNPVQQTQFAQSNPPLYQQILATIHRMNNINTQPSGKGHKKDKEKKGDETDTDTEGGSSSSSSSSSGSDTDGSNTDTSSEGSGSDTESEPEHVPSKTSGKKPKQQNQSQGQGGVHGQPHMVLGYSGYQQTNGYGHGKHGPSSKKSSSGSVEYLSLDFRNDLLDIDGNKYVLTFDTFHNVDKIELQSCIINQSYNLEGEPYIYISIDEIPGEYTLKSKATSGSLFGKLVLDKSVNGFLSYRPENCVKIFSTPESLSRFTISFAKYDQEKISLNKIAVKKLTKGDSHIKLVTTTAHNLSVGDRINMYNLSDSNEVIVNNLKVLEVADANTFVAESPLFAIGKNPDLSFEKLDVKCTLTFKIYRRSA